MLRNEGHGKEHERTVNIHECVIYIYICNVFCFPRRLGPCRHTQGLCESNDRFNKFTLEEELCGEQVCKT